MAVTSSISWALCKEGEKDGGRECLKGSGWGFGFLRKLRWISIRLSFPSEIG